VPDNAVAVPPRVLAALGRFRIAAMIVGVALLVLVAAMVLRYGFDRPGLATAWGPIHGFLYFAYFLIVVDLSFKARWTPVGTLWVILAGVVPVASFYAEKAVRRKVLAGERL
jgi:integral membrane protein